MATAGRTRSLGLALGLLSLAVAGGAAWFALSGGPAPAPSVPPPAPAPAPPAASPAPEPPAPGPAAAPSAKGLVEGRVLRGEKGETPMASTLVEVFPPDAGDALPFTQPLASARTGDDGKFRLEAPGAGPWTVRASALGLASATAPAKAGEPATLRLLPGGTVRGTVTDAETKEPITDAKVSAGGAVGGRSGPDGAFLIEGVAEGFAPVLARAPGYAAATVPVQVRAGAEARAEVRLRPAAAVAGTVLGTDGAPAEGATVQVEVLEDLPMFGFTAVGTHEARSGAGGRYRVEGVPVGKDLRASARTETAISKDVTVPALKRGIDAEGVDIRLEPAATLRVLVRDDDGAPVALAHVSVAPATGEAPKPEAAGDPAPADPEEVQAPAQVAVQEGLHAFAPGSVETDAEGVALVRPVRPGPVTVSARKQDFLEGSARAEATAGAPVGVEVKLPRGASVAGRVVDGNEQPVAEASVEVQRMGPAEWVHEERKSGPDGSFRVGGLKGKTFTVSASKERFVRTSLNEVAAGTKDLVVRLAPGGAIVGRAVDTAGKPVASIQAKAERTDEVHAPNPADPARFAEAMGGRHSSDPEGKFRIDGLATGVYALEVRGEGTAPARLADLRVVAGADTTVEVVLPEGLVLRGVVVRKSDDAPVAGARVRVQAKGPMGMMDFEADDLTGGDDGSDVSAGISAAMEGMAAMGGGGTTTGADGRFEIKGLEPGPVNLRVSAKEMSPTLVKDVALPAAGDLRVALAAGGTLEGTVYDASGAPKKGAMLMLQKLPMTMRMARTDERGRYRVGGLAAGSYLVYVMDENMMKGGGMNLRSETVRIAEGITLVKDFRPGQGTCVRGTVTRGGKAVGGVMVMLVPGSSANPLEAMGGAGGGLAMSTTKADGTYEISDVKPGRYTVSVQAGMGGPTGAEPVEVAAGAGEVRRDIVLPQNGIRGVVVDGAGKAVSGAQVTAVAAGKDVSRATDLGQVMESFGGQATTDDEGRFSMQDMKEGAYTLQVRAQGRGSAVLENVAASPAGGEVRVVLEAGVEVTVRVVAPDGKPVSGAGVYARDSRGHEVTNIEVFDAPRTGGDGRATFRVPAGQVTFEAVAEGYGPGEKVVEIPATGEVVVTLPKAAVLDVNVVDGAGTGVSGAKVLLLDSSGKPFAARVAMENIGELLSGGATGADGKVTRAGLPAGSYTVRASLEGRTAETAVSVAAGETKEVVVRLP